MKVSTKLIAIFLLTASSSIAVKAQQGFGTSNPAPSSVIDMTATNKGALLPRVALTSTIVAAPVNNPADALTVFNTATAGTAPNSVTPGYYYWSVAQLKWVRLLDQIPTVIQDLRLVGTRNHITQDAGVGSNGTSVGTGYDNVAIGPNALSKNTTGFENIAIGKNTLVNYPDALQSVAIGVGALQAGANKSVAIGWNTLGNANSTTEANVAVGNWTMKSLVTGVYNTAIGHYAIQDNISGNLNSALGLNSLAHTMGSNNIGIGYETGGFNENTNYSIFIGHQARSAKNLENVIAIGKNSLVNTSNSMSLGGLGVDAVNVGINTAAPAHKLHIVGAGGTTNPIRVEGLQTGSAGDKIVVADITGVLKTVSSITATPKFFYAPSMVMPTVNADLPSYVSYAGDTFTVDMYAFYNYQFSMMGETAVTKSAIKSAGAGTLDVLAASALGYFVTYFDNTVYDPTSISLSADGKLSYKILSGATITAKTYMNVVFKQL
ncbi:MAG: hypothetical protein EOO42_21230 [Flavobacteriales bacterium]|nr:MAG: hypothetical protein EOO42_21230 [Flavobacteriales bacterium]